MAPSPNVKQAVPFFNVRDMGRALEFYIGGLGFTMANKWVDEGKLRWCWLELGGAAVMLQEYLRDGPHANVPAGKLGEGVSICFMCEDSIAIWREAVARGLPAKRPFVGNGLWVTELSDPDGYRLAFESKTDAPEDSQYAG